MQRAAAEAELDREWLAQGGELAMKYRDAEFERFKETWLKAADARKRLAPCAGSVCRVAPALRRSCAGRGSVCRSANASVRMLRVG